MKKIVSAIIVTVVMLGFVSCGNSNGKTSANGVENPADTSAVNSRGGSGSGGFGRCLESGCYCKAFKGRGQTCQNCGHAYKRHY